MVARAEQPDKFDKHDASHVAHLGITDHLQSSAKTQSGTENHLAGPANTSGLVEKGVLPSCHIEGNHPKDHTGDGTHRASEHANDQTGKVHNQRAERDHHSKTEHDRTHPKDHEHGKHHTAHSDASTSSSTKPSGPASDSCPVDKGAFDKMQKPPGLTDSTKSDPSENATRSRAVDGRPSTDSAKQGPLNSRHDGRTEQQRIDDRLAKPTGDISVSGPDSTGQRDVPRRIADDSSKPHFVGGTKGDSPRIDDGRTKLPLGSPGDSPGPSWYKGPKPDSSGREISNQIRESRANGDAAGKGFKVIIPQLANA
jgi:hypothetical protein